MSTIRVDDVGPSAGGTTKSLVRGTASAWVNFNGTGTIAARDSENVSSLTDNGTGDYTVNFSNAFGAADYAATGMVGSTAGGSAQMLVPGGAPTTTAFRVEAFVWDASQVDPNYVAVDFLGDLA